MYNEMMNARGMWCVFGLGERAGKEPQHLLLLHGLHGQGTILPLYTSLHNVLTILSLQHVSQLAIFHLFLDFFFFGYLFSYSQELFALQTHCCYVGSLK